MGKRISLSTCAFSHTFAVLTMAMIILISIVIQFSMTGYWQITLYTSSTFETAKILVQNRASNKTNKQNVILNRNLINVIEGVRDRVIKKGLRNRDKENFTKGQTQDGNALIQVFWYNKPKWINYKHVNRQLSSQCKYDNCRISVDTSLEKCTAVIFTLSAHLNFPPPVARKNRNRDQVWIFFGLEPPPNYNSWTGYKHQSWMNTMNWSMTYRLDADIFSPYGMLKKRENILVRNYSEIFNRKTKQAAWLVSHCRAPSKRDQFVSELQRHGVQIDIFGRCANHKYIKSKEITSIISRDYKFYLGLENSFCKDYVTEKFFRYYNLDVILVVRGGANYDHTLPNETFINSAHFDSAKTLANFLLKVSSSEKLFTDYLRNKDRYVSYRRPTIPTAYCSLCEKLNNLDDNRNVYKNHVRYIHENTCWEASDIPVNA